MNIENNSEAPSLPRLQTFVFDNDKKILIFDCFWSFFAPESAYSRFSDEFEKKIDQNHVKIADFPIKAHFWATHKF